MIEYVFEYFLEKSAIFYTQDPVVFLVVLTCTLCTCGCSILLFLLTQHMASLLYYYNSRKETCQVPPEEEIN